MAKKKTTTVGKSLSTAADNVKDTAANVGSTIASKASGAVATVKRVASNAGKAVSKTATKAKKAVVKKEAAIKKSLSASATERSRCRGKSKWHVRRRCVRVPVSVAGVSSVLSEIRSSACSRSMVLRQI